MPILELIVYGVAPPAGAGKVSTSRTLYAWEKRYSDTMTVKN